MWIGSAKNITIRLKELHIIINEIRYVESSGGLCRGSFWFVKIEIEEKIPGQIVRRGCLFREKRKIAVAELLTLRRRPYTPCILGIFLNSDGYD